MAESCYAFNPLDIIKCENVILEFLQWRALVPTCSEYLKHILFLANPYQDFTEMVLKANHHIFKALFCYDLCIFNFSSIAISSLLCVCDELGYENFSNGLIELINAENLPFKMREVLECKALIMYLSTEEETVDAV